MRRCLFDLKFKTIGILIIPIVLILASLSSGANAAAGSCLLPNYCVVNYGSSGFTPDDSKLASCLADAGQGLNCTASDFKNATITLYEDAEFTTPKENCVSGESFTAYVSVLVEPGNSIRYDLHMYNYTGENFDLTQGSAYSGDSCDIQGLVDEAPWLNADGDIEAGALNCADVGGTGSTPVQVKLAEPITFYCSATATGKLAFKPCFSWSNSLTQSTFDTQGQCTSYPPNGSKCDCSVSEIDVTVMGSITVKKEAEPADGTTFTFDIQRDGVDLLTDVALDDAVPDDLDEEGNTSEPIEVNLVAGETTSISITEDPIDNWAATGWTCVSEDTTPPTSISYDENNPEHSTDSVSVNLSYTGIQNWTCTFYNELQVKPVQVTKKVENPYNLTIAETFEVKLVCDLGGDPATTADNNTLVATYAFSNDGAETSVTPAGGFILDANNDPLVPIGADCAVDETTVLNDDWTVDESATLIVSAEGSNTLEVVNTYKPERTIAVKKEVPVDDEAFAGGTAFDVELMCDINGDGFVKVALDDNSLTDGQASSSSNALPVGTKCYAVESPVPDNWEASSNYGAADNTLAVNIDGNAVITITNTRKEIDVEVRKEVVTDPNPLPDGLTVPDDNFSITLSCKDGETEVYAGTVELGDGDTHTFTVPSGSVCEVSEADKGGDWAYPPVYSKDGDTHVVTNTWMPTFDVTLEKTVSVPNPLLSAAPATDTFDLSLVCTAPDYDSSAPDSDKIKETSGSVSADGIITLEGIPAGWTCTGGEGAVEAPYAAGPASGATVVSGDTKLSIQNIYDPRYEVTLKKQVTGYTPFEAVDLTISVHCVIQDYYDETATSVTLNPDGASSGAILGNTSLTDVPYGASCEYSESPNPLDSDWTATVPDDDESITDDVTRTIVNHYNPVRDVVVKKECYQADGATSRTCSDEFTVTLNCGAAETITFNEDEGYSHTKPSVAAGTSCTATENTTNLGNWIPMTASATGTVAVEGGLTLTVKNRYAPPKLTLIKNLENCDFIGCAGIQATDWTLSATGPTPISGATGGASITSAEVNAGTYTLSETGPSGFNASAWTCTVNGTSRTGSSLTLKPDDVASCEITNTYIRQCETAFAMGPGDMDFGGKRWGAGWYFEDSGTINADLIAGQNDDVGNVQLIWDKASGTFNWTITSLDSDWEITQTHVYADVNKWKKVAPGKYYIGNTSGNELYVIFHAVVCEAKSD